MEDQLLFGEWLEDQYLGKGMTQDTFADAVGVGQSTVSGWVRGAAKPRRRIVPKIAEALGVDPDVVLRRAGLLREREAREHTAMYVMDDRGINLRDTLVSYTAANHDKLTEEQKRVLIDLAETFVRMNNAGEHDES